MVETEYPLISVIIPTWNRREVLCRALDSVLGQTYPNLELIVVDDGSLDDTVEHLNKHYQGRITLVEQENAGVSAARNTGISHCKGLWIALLDSDDWWLEDKLMTQYKTVTESGNLVCHTEEIWIRNGKRVNQCKHHKKYGGEVFDKMLPLCGMSPSSILIHRNVFESVGLFDESLPACEDYDLWLRITAHFSVDFVETPLIMKTGGHADQLSQAYPAMDRFRLYALSKVIHDANISQEKRKLALKMMQKKTSIYAGGSRKRNKEEQALEAEQMLKECESVFEYQE